MKYQEARADGLSPEAEIKPQLADGMYATGASVSTWLHYLFIAIMV